MRDSYVPNFKVPGRRGPSTAMWLTLLLCLVLPPLGMGLLWGRVRCPLRGKVWISSISLLILVAQLTLFMDWRERASYVVPQVPVAYVYGDASTTGQPGGTVSQAQDYVPANENPVDQPQEDLPADLDLVPANPMG